MTDPTPKRSAEQIAVDVWESLPGFDEVNAEDGIEIIAKALRHYAEDQIREARKSAAFIKQTACAKLINEARAEALEEALEILRQEHPDDYKLMNGYDAIRALSRSVPQERA